MVRSSGHQVAASLLAGVVEGVGAVITLVLKAGNIGLLSSLLHVSPQGRCGHAVTRGLHLQGCHLDLGAMEGRHLPLAPRPTAGVVLHGKLREVLRVDLWDRLVTSSFSFPLPMVW